MKLLIIITALTFSHTYFASDTKPQTTQSTKKKKSKNKPKTQHDSSKSKCRECAAELSFAHASPFGSVLSLCGACYREYLRSQ